MTTSTLTVTDFVLARIAEDEAAAKRIARSPMNRWPHPDPHAGELGVFYDQGEGLEVHPARVLAQCAAMRQVVRLYLDTTHFEPDDPYDTALLDVMRILAMPYADHPDWREEWRA